MKIFCIGRNYSEHAAEMNSEVPEKPIFFMKPESSLLMKNKDFYYPTFTKNLHYEAEIVIRINRLGKHIEKKFANRYYDEIAFGIDFTARDLQKECKEKGLPWEISKGFEGSAPLSKFIKLDSLNKSVDNLDFHLEINGETVQKANTSEMIFQVDELIEYLSSFMTLKIGDLIYTGTPAGVGPLQKGDNLKGFIESQEMMNMKIK